jgi:3-hydroxyisobutyrate dehydrogenase-like beta-hydroxyacid dehydrogenase
MGNDERDAVTVLGTGAIGTQVARVFLAGGRRVTVWNRTPARAAALVDDGAIQAGTASAAVESSPLVVACLTDYAALAATVRETWDALPDRTLVALVTGSPREARAAAEQAAAAGAGYLDAGLQTAPEGIGTEAAAIFYSGPAEVFERHRRTLAVLGRTRYAGADPGAAAVCDLALFGLWYDAQLGYLRALETARAAGVDVRSFAPMAAVQLGHVVADAENTAGEVATRTFPRGPADLEEHESVLTRLVELRSGQRLGTGDLEAALGLVRHHIARGRGGDGLNAIVDPPA